MQLWRLCEFEEAWECSMADFADPPEPLNTDWLQVRKPDKSKPLVSHSPLQLRFVKPL